MCFLRYADYGLIFAAIDYWGVRALPTPFIRFFAVDCDATIKTLEALNSSHIKMVVFITLR